MHLFFWSHGGGGKKVAGLCFNRLPTGKIVVSPVLLYFQHIFCKDKNHNRFRQFLLSLFYMPFSQHSTKLWEMVGLNKWSKIISLLQCAYFSLLSKSACTQGLPSWGNSSLSCNVPGSCDHWLGPFQLVSDKQCQRGKPESLNDHMIHSTTSLICLTAMQKIKNCMAHLTISLLSNGNSDPSCGWGWPGCHSTIKECLFLHLKNHADPDQHFWPVLNFCLSSTWTVWKQLVHLLMMTAKISIVHDWYVKEKNVKIFRCYVSSLVA